MLLHHIIIIAVIQGLTEFLPISSSGHLVLAHAWIEGDFRQVLWKSEDVLLDVAVHVGTLLSVCLYFYRDIFAMTAGGFDLLKGKWTPSGKLGSLVIVSSLPVILCGVIVFAVEPDWMRSVEVMAWATLVFGIVLWAADRFRPDTKTLDRLGWRGAFIIGLAQCLALIPGTSRSGITMTAARFLGFSRTEAARYALLLAIVAILGAGTLATLDLIDKGDFELTMSALLAAFLAFVSGWVSIALMMKWLSFSTFTPFAVYRVVLGAGLLIYLYGFV